MHPFHPFHTTTTTTTTTTDTTTDTTAAATFARRPLLGEDATLALCVTRSLVGRGAGCEPQLAKLDFVIAKRLELGEHASWLWCTNAIGDGCRSR
jgi:hypothetical protein